MGKDINLDALRYPIDGEYLLQKQRGLKRALFAQTVTRVPKKIAVLGGSTTNDIVDMLTLFLLDAGIAPEFYVSEYQKYWEDAMFDNPELAAFSPDVIFIHTSIHNITEAPLPLSASDEEIDSSLARQMQHFTEMWEKLAETYGCAIIQNNFEDPPYRLMGNRDAWDRHGMVWYVRELNMRFAAYAREHQSFYLHDLHYVAACYGLDAWQDPEPWYLYKYAMPIAAIPEYSYSVFRILRSLFGGNKKVLAVDLDNTLWGGVIGDDGVAGIAIGQETAEAEGYFAVQEYVKAQQQLGVILVVNSKNDRENALSGFTHPDSVLKAEDFAYIAANWEPKDENIRTAAATLNLLPESFVFLDDNPAEREIVTRQIPGVAVVPFETPGELIRVCDRGGFFEMTTFSEEDANRNEMYRANAARAESARKFENYTDYLKSLEMEAEIRDFTPTALPRITQLTNKSNQFNVTTRRYTMEEMEAVAGDVTRIRLFGRLRDKFGDNGIVSVVIGKIEGNAVTIELWLMSCRVLKRDMEFAMLDAFVAQCRARGVTTIYGNYLKTPKNAMVRDLFGTFGFTKIAEDTAGNSKWQLDPDGYTPKNHVIAVNETEEKQ